MYFDFFLFQNKIFRFIFKKLKFFIKKNKILKFLKLLIPSPYPYKWLRRGSIIEAVGELKISPV